MSLTNTTAERSRSGADENPVVLDAFISYSRRDSDAVTMIVDAARRQGRSFWIDSTAIPAGTVWRNELNRALQSASAVVCLISPAWLQSTECRAELARALSLGKRVIPVMLDAIEQSALPPELLALQWIAGRGRAPDQVATAVVAAIDTDSDRVREHTHWLNQAIRWEDGGKHSSLLVRGRDLRAAENWLQSSGTDPRPIPLQIEYVTASRRVERRRSRTLLAAALLAMVISLAFAGLALYQRNVAVEEERIATARQLLAQAGAVRDTDTHTALMFGIAAEDVHPDDQTRSELLNTVLGTNMMVSLPGNSGSAFRTSFAFARGGRTLATASYDGKVDLWDWATLGHPSLVGQLASKLSPVAALAFSPDGRTLATGGSDIAETGDLDGTVVLWDVSDPSHPAQSGRPLIGHTWDLTSVAFAPNGQTLATGSADHTVILWDVSDPARPTQIGQPLAGHSDGVTSVAFTPDGQTLATGSNDKASRLWDLSGLNYLRDHIIDRACSMAGRSLSPDEWARNVPGLPFNDSCGN